MANDPEIERDLKWLVPARNQIQSLMLRLLQQWEVMPRWRRQTAIAVAFSLWRAVFLLVRDEDGEPERVDAAAKKFLKRVVRRNTIGFSDDVARRAWTSVYYVDNAVLRLQRDITDYDFIAEGDSPMGSVRDRWKEALQQLDRLVPGSEKALPLSDDDVQRQER